MVRRKGSKLPKAIDGRLKMYSLMAMAAGVGVAAGLVPAEAQIVYTPAHVELNQEFEMDLNNDGLNDFNLIPWDSASIGGSLRTSWLDVCHSPAEGTHACVQSSSSIQANKDNVVPDDGRRRGGAYGGGSDWTAARIHRYGPGCIYGRQGLLLRHQQKSKGGMERAVGEQRQRRHGSIPGAEVQDRRPVSLWLGEDHREGRSASWNTWRIYCIPAGLRV